jgi:hypothetical protein
VGGYSRNRIAALTLIVGALLLRAMLPTGFMLAPGAAGGVEITLCDGIALAHHHGDQGRHSQGAQPCPFAIALNPATPPVAALLLAPPAPLPAPTVVPPRQTPRLAFAAITPPATGPPALL